MKSLSTYINNISRTAPTDKTMKGFFSNVGGDPIKRTIDIINKLRNIKDYGHNIDYCINLCMQFPVDFGMHIRSRDNLHSKRYHLYYTKNKKGTFDWVEENGDEYSNLDDNASTTAKNIAESLYIVFSGDYIVKPCFRDKNNNFKDL